MMLTALGSTITCSGLFLLHTWLTAVCRSGADSVLRAGHQNQGGIPVLSGKYLCRGQGLLGLVQIAVPG